MRKKLGTVALLTALAALGSTASASANLSPGQFKNASKFCKALERQMGDDAFADAFGTNENNRNAFGKCVSRKGVLPAPPVTTEPVEPPLPVSAFGTTPNGKHPDKPKK